MNRISLPEYFQLIRLYLVLSIAMGILALTWLAGIGGAYPWLAMRLTLAVELILFWRDDALRSARLRWPKRYRAWLVVGAVLTLFSAFMAIGVVDILIDGR